MTALPELTFTWETPAAHVRRVALNGSLAYVNADALLRSITDNLVDNQDLRELHVDCAGLDMCDSRGLATLLTLRRRTEVLGVELHIVNRPALLNRMMDRTGTTTFLTGETETPAESRQGEPSR
jgi:anti-anti-sigma factor